MLCKIKVTRNLHHAPRPGRELRNQPHVHVRECAVPILPRRSSGNRASLTQAQLGAGMTERATALPRRHHEGEADDHEHHSGHLRERERLAEKHPGPKRRPRRLSRLGTGT